MLSGATPAAAARHSNPLLAICPQLLAVELLLLAFFIILNGASSFEAGRSRSVLESLHQALGTSMAEDAGGGLQGEAATLAGVEQRIARLAQAVGAVQAQGPSRPDALWIDLPADVFFRPGEDRMNPTQARFVERLSALLANTPESYGYEVAVLRGGADTAAGDGDLRLRQAGAVAAALQARIERRGTIAAGLVPDPAIGLRLDVSWRAPEEMPAKPAAPAAAGYRGVR